MTNTPALTINHDQMFKFVIITHTIRTLTIDHDNVFEIIIIVYTPARTINHD